MYSCLPRLPSETSIFFCFTGVGPVDRTGVVKIIAFLELKQKLTFFKGLNNPEG
jgi:hypothetical protein